MRQIQRWGVVFWMNAKFSTFYNDLKWVTIPHLFVNRFSAGDFPSVNRLENIFPLCFSLTSKDILISRSITNSKNKSRIKKQVSTLSVTLENQCFYWSNFNYKVIFYTFRWQKKWQSSSGGTEIWFEDTKTQSFLKGSEI